MASKKISNEDIVRLFDLCLQVNALGKDTVFFEYSAHVKEVAVDVHLGGWVSGIGPDEQFRFYATKKGCASTAKIPYAACLIYLEGMLYA